jgi:hypothetical protein
LLFAQVSNTVKAFMAAKLPNELIEVSLVRILDGRNLLCFILASGENHITRAGRWRVPD